MDHDSLTCRDSGRHLGVAPVSQADLDLADGYRPVGLDDEGSVALEQGEHGEAHDILPDSEHDLHVCARARQQGGCELRVFELDLKDVAFSWKGWNWGEALVECSSLAFRVEDKAALEIPLAAVSQAIASNRKEAIIELADDDTAAPEDEMVVGIRFHVPAAARDDERRPMGCSEYADTEQAAHITSTLRRPIVLAAVGATQQSSRKAQEELEPRALRSAPTLVWLVHSESP